MPNKIKWSPNEYYKDVPIDTVLPTKKVIPEWYKKFSSKKPEHEENVIPSNFTVKKCMPIFDAFTSGYVITTSMALGFKRESDGNLKVSWGPENGVPLNSRNTGGIPLEFIPVGFSPYEFVWKIQETIEIPKGYSILMTHPLNRPDLPFHTLSGIVDGGWSMYGGNIPFFIKEGFEGVIPEGTPIIQIIPFKNESWVSEKDLTLIEKGNIQKKLRLRFASDWYKHTWWNKKSYD